MRRDVRRLTGHGRDDGRPRRRRACRCRRQRLSALRCFDAVLRDAWLTSRCATHVENGAPSPIRARVPITFNLDE
ncbi:uncharacterized protein BCN122_II2727 [Burkholderia cenocepacia]|nr:uncharacterized protein BCN122_II2727 [Burkholderia cenocepacia]